MPLPLFRKTHLNTLKGDKSDLLLLPLTLEMNGCWVSNALTLTTIFFFHKLIIRAGVGGWKSGVLGSLSALGSELN